MSPDSTPPLGIWSSYLGTHPKPRAMPHWACANANTREPYQARLVPALCLRSVETIDDYSDLPATSAAMRSASLVLSAA